MTVQGGLRHPHRPRMARARPGRPLWGRRRVPCPRAGERSGGQLGATRSVRRSRWLLPAELEETTNREDPDPSERAESEDAPVSEGEVGGSSAVDRGTARGCSRRHRFRRGFALPGPLRWDRSAVATPAPGSSWGVLGRASGVSLNGRFASSSSSPGFMLSPLRSRVDRLGLSEEPTPRQFRRWTFGSESRSIRSE